MSEQNFQIIELFVTLIPILTIAWKGSSMLTRLEQMVQNLDKCIQELRRDRERDRLEIKEIQENHEHRIRCLEEELIIVKEEVKNEHNY